MAAADDVLKFKVDLVGNMVSELVAGGKAANTAEGGVQALTAAILQMTEASEKKKDKGFFTFDLAKGAELAVDVVKKLAEEIYDLGKEIITTAAGAQDLAFAVKSAAGPENVEGIQRIADSFGDTRFDDDEVKKWVLPLLNVGLGKDNPSLLQDIVTAATDNAARLADPAGVQAVLDTFQHIHTKREVNAKMLLGVGINEADFYTSLGETLGRSSKQAEAMVKAGKVKAETLEAELLAAIAKREGGQLGKATDESAKSLGTTLQRLKNLPENLFKQLADSPGLLLLQERVDHFVNTLLGPAGTKIVEKLGGALDDLSKYLIGDEQAADKFVDAIISGVPQVVEALKLAVEAAKLLVPVMQVVVDGLATAAGLYYQITGKTPESTETDVSYGPTYWMENINNQETYDLAQKYGEQITQGVVDGILKGDTTVEDAVRILAQKGRIALAEEWDSHSPSRVAMKLGASVPEGFAIGVERGGSRVEAAARSTLADRVLAASGSPTVAAARGGGGTFAPVYAPVYQLPAGTPEDAIRRADERSRAEFARFLDEARARYGAAA